MDINLAYTFLEIVRCGSFIAAAEKIHVTQTTVTARVHNLESQIGCKLFIRNRFGATLTVDGQRFITHAVKLVQSWEAAKRELPLSDCTRKILNIGGEHSLWSPLMLQWLSALNINDANTELAVRAEVGERQSLMEKLEHGVLDIIVVHQPEYWPGIQVEELLEEKLILVASKNQPEPYIYIDWGEHFRKQHDVALPELSKTQLTLNLGPLALQYILENGGSGYFRTRVVEHHIRAGLLEHKLEYPQFTFPVYVLYRKSDRERFKEEIEALSDSCKIDSSWS